MSDLNNIELSSAVRNDPLEFADKMLGIWPHPGQQKWIRESSKRLISFLRPGNRWGKTLGEAILHIWEATIKPRRTGQVWSEDEWLRIPYDTLIFGPQYEQSREVLRLMVDMVEGNLNIQCCPNCNSHKIHKRTAKDKIFNCLHCGYKFKNAKYRVNDSSLKGWAIEDDKSSAQLMPGITWFNKSQTLGRSFDDMGKSFKMKALAFITGDECSDVQELYTFTTNTLLPRLASYKGSIHFVGTPQPNGFDYQRMIETAEEEMKRPNWDSQGLYYVQRGSMYDNIYLDRTFIRQIESVADPELRRQIIDGEFVNVGEKFFGHERVRNMIDPELKVIEEGIPGRMYLVSADFASGNSLWADYTVIGVFDYTEEPWKLVKFIRMKAKDVPVPLQYEMIRDLSRKFRGKVIIDASGPGGKNAQAFLRDIYPINFDAGPTGSGGSKKAQGLANLKSAMDGTGNVLLNRKLIITKDGVRKDLNKNWGLIRVPNIPELIGELTNYAFADKKLRTDCVMMLMMAVDWLMMRRPKQSHNRAVSIDFLRSMVKDDREWPKGDVCPYERHTRAVSY